MSFASETGYLPIPVGQMMAIIRENINTQFNQSYTESNFVGTNWYKYFYALVQQLVVEQAKTSEIFSQLQQYFVLTNEKLSRPNTTAPGIIDYFASKGFFVSVKPPIDLDAGKVFICVDTDADADDYEQTKEELGGYVRDCVVAGVVSQGTEEVEIVLSNSQAFTFKYNLPDRIPILIKVTLTQSDNNDFAIPPPEETRQKVYDKINSIYRLGKNFEPQRYFSVADAPWCSEVLLEYSEDEGSSYTAAVAVNDYDEVFTFGLTDIEIVEA